MDLPVPAVGGGLLRDREKYIESILSLTTTRRLRIQRTKRERSGAVRSTLRTLREQLWWAVELQRTSIYPAALPRLANPRRLLVNRREARLAHTN